MLVTNHIIQEQLDEDLVSGTNNLGLVSTPQVLSYFGQLCSWI